MAGSSTPLAAAGAQTDAGALVERLRSMALRALARMYLPREQAFAFRVRRVARGASAIALEGVSGRYTAMALIGLRAHPGQTVGEVLAGQNPMDVCGRLLERAARSEDLGEVALALWCARVWEHAAATTALCRLRALEPARSPDRTVELAWALTAQVVPGSAERDERLAEAIAERLLASFEPGSNLFPHWPAGACPARVRAHVTCLADLVYPIQALAHYHGALGCREALEAARRCAERLCALQGADGQWWWHFDVRTGRVVEQYPVYAVHQDAMVPMALSALERAGGGDRTHGEAVERGLRWLAHAPELAGGALVDTETGFIWRKVYRHEPGKLVRSVQAGASRVHPALRLPGANLVFPPGRVDYESRPYHMGWILHAWPPARQM